MRKDVSYNLTEHSQTYETTVKIVLSGYFAVHRLLTVHQLVRVSVSLRVKFRVRARDMVKLKLMDQGDVTVSITAIRVTVS